MAYSQNQCLVQNETQGTGLRAGRACGKNLELDVLQLNPAQTKIEQMTCALLNIEVPACYINPYL